MEGMDKAKAVASVVVPLYNSRETIAGCLKAVRGQEGFEPGELELIVVDDGSTDGGGAAAGDLSDKMVALPDNRGAAAARNRGAKEASADVVVFVDADVVLEPGAVSALLEVFNKSSQVMAAVGRYTERPAVPGVVNLYHNAFTRFHHDLSPMEIDWFWGALGAVRKEALFSVGGFDERYQGASAEDMDLGIRLAEAGHKIRYCPEAEGAHTHNFTVRSMLINDYKKAVLGTKLRIKGRLPQRAPGFASAGNALTAPTLLLLLYLLATRLLSPMWIIIDAILLACLLVINERFYSYLSKTMPRMVDYGLMLHWLQSAAIVAGAVAGVAGHVLGRSPHGRPGWW